MKNAVFGILFVILMAGCASPEPDNSIHSTQLIKSSASWDGQPLPAYKTGTPEITILRITIPAGMTLPMHKHPVINAGVLLKGKLTVITENGDILHLKPYDPIVETVETWHYGKNEGTEPAEIIVFYAGEKHAPLTIKQPGNKRPDNIELKAPDKAAP